ncbi:ANL_HP_G0165970.mRNA.1.CDS.1 [Saccharomyces cerevisiae]|nr:ANL_HP_G0046160.mRNA.1.CDS.1 [Saccharomyces cerevisiae]CAI5074975.1 ANL_HP_G0097510.mRNA.1.CDS.1 [Saccharomyces cerevisiae]CAI5212272.1 ANL_HP_G0165970.mRNA.1.CDS.1 [Saccharomyces cerevisiae]CAI6856125.1 ANL_HP_G0046160.mRNA.1.CDS.1 [Saccharomyces cerevisiae]CAI6966151.1 ANL_HP_G0097510.mRNA.1.CDS.1 [Saccharomyces cerevisiae]
MGGSSDSDSHDGYLTSEYNSSNSLFSLNTGNSYSSASLDRATLDCQDSVFFDNHKSSLLSTEVPRFISNDPLHLPITLNYKRDNADPTYTNGKVNKFMIVLIGLPATGKSTISSHLIQCLKNNPLTNSLRCKVFNAGKIRRQISCATISKPLLLSNTSSEDLFNPKNNDKKETYARITLQKLFHEINNDECDVGIFDATNSTIERRRFIFEEVCSFNTDELSSFNLVPIILQVSCFNRSFIKYNIHNKSFNDDYLDKPYELAIKDFAKRLKHYYSQFTPFSLDEFNQIHRYISQHEEIDTSLFFFNVINAGVVEPHSLNQSHYPSTCGKQIRDTIMVIENFINHYSQMFGFEYIEAVKLFFESFGNSSEETLTTLDSVVNDKFFDDLQSLIESNGFA